MPSVILALSIRFIAKGGFNGRSRAILNFSRLAIRDANCYTEAAPERHMRSSVFRTTSFLHKKLDSLLFSDVVKKQEV